ncbi:MAG: LamG-like jellyroll fold domain-containing protein [Verrucomicrobiota bacterium]
MELKYPFLILSIAVVSSSTHAVPIEISNADFESGPDGVTADSWSDIVDDVIYYLPGEGPYVGNRALSIQAVNPITGDANYAQQDLGEEVAGFSGSTITIQFDGAFRNDTAQASGIGVADLQVALVDGSDGTILDAEIVTLSASGQAANPASVPFAQQSVNLSYTSASSENLFLRFTNPVTELNGQSRGSTTVVVDNVSAESNALRDPFIQTNGSQDFENNGGSETLQVSFANDAAATQTLSLTSVIVGGADSSFFTFDVADLPISALPGETGIIELDFAPTEPGPYEIELTVTSNDAIASPSLIVISVNVSDPVAEVNPMSIDFGLVPASPGPQTRAISITNLGTNEDLLINAITVTPVSGAFSVGSFPSTLGPLMNTSVDVTFDPGAVSGAFSGMITIETNDFDNPILAIPIKSAVEVDLGGTSLVSHWDFENSASLGDDLGNFNNDGVVNGDATQTSIAAVGNGALLLDGDGDFIEVPLTGGSYQTLNDNGNGFSVAAWVCLDSSFTPIDSRGSQRIFSTYMPGGFVTEGFGVGVETEIPNLLGTTFGFSDFRGGLVPDPEEWHHLTFVFRGNPIGSIEYFVDGVSAGTFAAATAGLNDTTVTSYAIGGLGLSPSALQWFDGLIDDLRIYDVELLETDAAALTALGVAGPKSTSVLKVTDVFFVDTETLRIEFSGEANTAYSVASSVDLTASPFIGPVSISSDGLTTDSSGVGFVEIEASLPGPIFYQIQLP